MTYTAFYWLMTYTDHLSLYQVQVANISDDG